MAKDKKVVIKETELSNNCPECFNQKLKLSFYQKHTYGAFFHKVTNEVTNQIVCLKCSSMIYPVKWTDDIERMFTYYQKMAVPEKTSSRPTSLSYALLLALVALIIGVAYLFLKGII